MTREITVRTLLRRLGEDTFQVIEQAALRWCKEHNDHMGSLVVHGLPTCGTFLIADEPEPDGFKGCDLENPPEHWVDLKMESLSKDDWIGRMA